MMVHVLTESSGLVGVFATRELAMMFMAESVLNGDEFDDPQLQEVNVVGDNSGGPLDDEDNPDDKPHYPVLYDDEGDEWRHIGEGLYTLVSFYDDYGNPVLDDDLRWYTVETIREEFGGVDTEPPTL